jgi:hypothetical protein
MDIQEIFFAKREIKNGGVFLHFKKNNKEKVGVPLFKISDNIIYPLNSEPLSMCFNENGELKVPNKEIIEYQIDKIYKISSEHFVGEDVKIYVIKIYGDENTIGFVAHPEELEK